MGLLSVLVVVATVATAAAASGLTPRERAAALLLNMTLDEKVSMLHGINPTPYTGATSGVARLGTPALLLNDGRQGFRPNDQSPTQTAFPCQLANVASWRRDLWYDFGHAMAEEFYGKGANVILAPMLILARVPQGGRNFESCGEDPALAYAFAYADIQGEQSVPGVMANADDFVLNNQETDRTSITAACDDRTRTELYYGGYRGATESGVNSIMCSYNLISTVR
jgi:beta-glucosidase